MEQEAFNEKFRKRTKDLALQTIKMVMGIPYNDSAGVIKKQAIRSITSVAANFRAACRARSEKEKFAKLCIVVEEADESLFWFEILEESGLIHTSLITGIKDETEEILKVMASFKKKLQPRTI